MTTRPRPDLRRVCLETYLLALGVRAVVALRAGTLYPDGVVELRVAEALAAGRWADALETRFHPLLGALTALLTTLTGASAESSALLICVLGSALVAPALALAAARLAPDTPQRAAWVAGALAACHPYLGRLGGQVLAYGLAHAALALALAMTLTAASRASLRWAALAGATAGVGYLARSDALATSAGMGLGLVLAWQGEQRWRPALVFAGCALLSTLPFLVPLSAHHGQPMLSPKKPLSTFVQFARSQPAPRAAPTETLGTWITLEIGADPTRPGLPPSLASAALFSLRKATSAVHPLVVILCLLAFVGVWRRERAPPLWCVPLLALGAFVSAHVILKASHGYTSRLHQSAAAVCAIPLAALGLSRLSALAPRLPATVLGVAILLFLPRAIAPQLGHKAIEAEVGAWIRRHAGEPTVVAGRGEVRGVAYRAGARFVEIALHIHPREALTRARAAGARYLVLYVRGRGRWKGELIPRLEALGARPLRAPFRAERDDVRYAWWILKL